MTLLSLSFYVSASTKDLTVLSAWRKPSLPYLVHRHHRHLHHHPLHLHPPHHLHHPRIVSLPFFVLVLAKPDLKSLKERKRQDTHPFVFWVSGFLI